MHPMTVRAETYMTEGRRPSAVEEAGALRATIGRRMSPWTLTLIVLVVGALVGFIVIAILLPIFKMSSAIH